MDYHDIEWFALEMNRDHSVVFEIASKYCISDSFVDHDGYSISSNGEMVQERGQEELPLTLDTVAERSYPTSKVRSSGCALLEQP